MIPFLNSPRALRLSLFLLAPCSLWAQESVDVIQMVWPAPAGQTLEITAQGLPASSFTQYRFRLEGAASLGNGVTPAPWVQVPGTFVPIIGNPQGRYKITVPTAALNRQFYRVVQTSGTAEDQDGDGLADTFETSTTGTNTSLFDTDNDGFNDGLEFAAGTDPLSAASKPNNGLPPIVEFLSTSIEATEGTATSVSLVLDRAFTGTVNYTVLGAPTSTAVAPADYAALSGSVSVNGTSATIPITWVDDLDIDPVRFLFINLVTPPTGGAYTTGGKSFLTIRLMENDAYWDGVLGAPPDSAGDKSFITRNFRIKLLKSGSTQEVWFVAGQGHDGLPSLGDGQSQTEGLVPAGAWLGTLTSNTASSFVVGSPNFSVATTGGVLSSGGSLFGAVSDLLRQINLNSAPGLAMPYAEITPARISGLWQENQSSVSAPYLNRTSSGIFVLVKSIPTVSQPVLPLLP